MKLCVPEAESQALFEVVRGLERSVSSELTVVETTRALMRLQGDAGRHLAESVCGRLDVIPIGRSIIDRAARLGPAELRSLDAIHLATVLELRRPPVVIAYDRRLLAAAEAHDLSTASPGI